MNAMRSMGGPLVKGRGEHGAIVMCGGKGGMTEGDMIRYRDLLEKRPDMMQMMMEPMIQRDQVTQSMLMTARVYAQHGCGCETALKASA